MDNFEVSGKEEKLARAISAYSRRQILRLLAEQELTVNQICKATGQSKSLASRHLTLLYDLGFLSVRRAPPFKYYSLKMKDLKQLLELYDKVIDKL
jgi:DNA-binding transcriptional ArsR family regulator